MQTTFSNHLVKRTVNGVNFYVDTFSAHDIYFEEKIFNNSIDLKNMLDYLYIKDSKYKIFSVTIELLNSCNFSCPFCYINCNNKKTRLNYEQLITTLDYLINNGLIYCTLTGGEIFLYYKFTELYMYLKQRGVMVTLFTNLSLLTDNILKMLTEYKPFNVEVSIYGISDETFYDTTKCSTINFKKVLDNIILLRKNGINVSCKMLNVKTNYKEFDTVKSWCLNNNINFRYSNVLFNKYDNSKVSDTLLVNESVTYQKYKLQKCEVDSKKIIFDCSAGKYSMFIGADNKIRPCWKFYMIESYKVSLDENTIEEAISLLENKINSIKGKILPGCKCCKANKLCSECIVYLLGNKKYNLLKKCKEYEKLYDILISKGEY